MGHPTQSVAVIVAVALSAACGDPLVIVGDASGILRIIAGVPDQGGATVGASAIETLLNDPQGLAMDASGTLYIADRENARILAVASSGQVSVLVDHSAVTGTPRLRSPEALALDGGGRLLIADRASHIVWGLDMTTGELTLIAGTGVAGSTADGASAQGSAISRPSGLVVPGDGRVYFSEGGAHRVRSIEPNGTLRTIAGDGVAGLDGDEGPALAARLNTPTGLAFGADVLYIADTGNHRIRAVDVSTGNILTLAGTTIGYAGDGGPAAESKFRGPRSVTLSRDGRTLYVADSNNHRIRSVNLVTFTIETFAGTGESAFNGDLLAAGETALSLPRGVLVSEFDFLFIADSGHNIVRRTAVRFVSRP